MRNAVRERWQAGEPALGAWMMMPSPMAAEEIGQLGYDYVCIDMQHGMIDYATAVTMIAAINLGGSAPFVRVPWNSHDHISNMLDAGALGIIIPMVNSPAQAAEAAKSCRYPPQGERSHAVTRAARLEGGASGKVATPAEMNEAVLCVPMVETTEAVACLDEICDVPGVDAVFVGPGDLSISLGLEPGNNDGVKSFDDALAEILRRCEANGVPAGIQGNPKVAATRVDQGFQLVTVAVDNTQMRQGMAQALAQFR